MADSFDTLVLNVRADTQGLARDVETMRSLLEGPLAAGADRAGRAMQSALDRFVRTGKLGFDDLKRVALSALSEIAQAQLAQAIGGSSSLGSALAGLFGSLFGALGLPGRATGGPVAPGRAYMVGERGPEVFVPTSSGTVLAQGATRPPISITVNVTAPRDTPPGLMAASGRQVAREVARLLPEVYR